MAMAHVNNPRLALKYAQTLLLHGAKDRKQAVTTAIKLLKNPQGPHGPLNAFLQDISVVGHAQECTAFNRDRSAENCPCTCGLDDVTTFLNNRKRSQRVA